MSPGQAADDINVLTLNCWGLKFISKYRSERLHEIGKQIRDHVPVLQIVGLQECWTYSDYLDIKLIVNEILPYSKFYNSGIFGGGLAIFSAWPIEDSSMFRYPLNGRPTAFFRGDWFVGKGVACTRVRMPGGQAIEVFNTHLHAPYEREPNDSYICHRTAQAWEIAKLMRNATERGSLVLGLGDFNMVPMSFAHCLIEARGNVADVWRKLKPSSSIGASIDAPEAERREKLGLNLTPNVEESLDEHGHTCDSILNTWRWSDNARKALERGRDQDISMNEPDPRAKRLDYIFFGENQKQWRVEHVAVDLKGRHPTLRCSLSDHFAVYAEIRRMDTSLASATVVQAQGICEHENMTRANIDTVSLHDGGFERVISKEVTKTTLGAGFYKDILAMIDEYKLRERKQRRWRLGHFLTASFVTIGCYVAVWWSPRNFVAFLLMLLSSLGLMAGTVDGLIGGLFVGSELRALSEFEWEVRNALAHTSGEAHIEEGVRDWYD